MERRVAGYCALCRSRCGAVAVVDGDRLVRVEPFPDHPTGVALCIKGKAAPEIQANPNRLLHPLKRTRPKTEADPGWQRISWDEALGTTADALRRIADRDGPEAVAFTVSSPSATPISDGLIWIERFINRFGSPNMCNATELCNWHKDHAHRFTFGRGISTPDFARSECVVLWGHNPSTSWLDHATSVSAAKARGAALIVVDPRQAGFAARADAWLRVRPGADAALALSLIGEMLAQRCYDAAFVARWTNAPLLVRSDTGRLLRARDLATHLPTDWLVAWDEGSNAPVWYDPNRADYVAQGVRPALFVDREIAPGLRCESVLERLRRRCAAYAPEAAEPVTGVPAERIRAAAALLGQRRPTAYYCWTGVGQHHNATQTDRAIAILMALTGSFDAPGGNVDFGRPSVAPVSGEHFLSDAQRRKMIGATQRPLGPALFGGGVVADDLYTAILDRAPYAVRALVGFGGNPLVTRADPDRGRRALQALDFHVQAGPVLNESARLADIVLPVNTQWEREGLRAGFDVSEAAASLIQLRPAAVPSAGESRSDMSIVFELAKRLGFASDFWNGDPDAALAAHLAPSGVTLAALRAAPEGIRVKLATRYRRHAECTDTGFRGVDTPSRLVEIFSERLQDGGHDPLPHAGAEIPVAHFPLILTTAKVPHYCHSQYRDIPSLRKRLPDPLVELHPDTAAARKIADGDWVQVLTPSAAIRLKAKFDRHLAQDVVCAQYGWEVANINALMNASLSDAISGSVTHRGLRCEVRRSPDQGAGAGQRTL